MSSESNTCPCTCNCPSLVQLFGLDQSLKLKRKDQIREIRKKIDDIIPIQNNKIKTQIEFYSKIDKYNKYRDKNSTPTIDPTFIKEEIFKNSFVLGTCIMSFIYFTKISNFLYKVNSLVIFKPVFLFTFCVAPLGISLYFSKLNIDYKNSHSYKQIKNKENLTLA